MCTVALWESWIDVNTSHIFSQVCLASLTLVGGGAEDEMSRARAKCELRLPCFSVAITALSGWKSGLKLLEQKA